jgi:hypothetical protein
MAHEDGHAGAAGAGEVRIRGPRLLLRAFRPGEIDAEWQAMVTAGPMAVAELPDEAGFKARLRRSGRLADGWLDLAIDLDGVPVGRIQTFVPPKRQYQCRHGHRRQRPAGDRAAPEQAHIPEPEGGPREPEAAKEQEGLEALLRERLVAPVGENGTLHPRQVPVIAWAGRHRWDPEAEHSRLPPGRRSSLRPRRWRARAPADGHGRTVGEKYPDSVLPSAAVASTRNLHRPGVIRTFAAKCPLSNRISFKDRSAPPGVTAAAVAEVMDVSRSCPRKNVK